jgi:hypothetical protein
MIRAGGGATPPPRSNLYFNVPLAKPQRTRENENRHEKFVMVGFPARMDGRGARPSALLAPRPRLD